MAGNLTIGTIGVTLFIVFQSRDIDILFGGEQSKRASQAGNNACVTKRISEYTTVSIGYCDKSFVVQGATITAID